MWMQHCLMYLLNCIYITHAKVNCLIEMNMFLDVYIVYICLSKDLCIMCTH